jgi:uncharacterized protein YlxP (DUF503 family)
MQPLHLLLVEYDLHLHGCHSLKDKRSVLQRLKHHLRVNHNVSLAETDHLDKWQRTRLAIVGIATARPPLETLARSLQEELESKFGVEILEVHEEWI